ncbi:MAG: flagellar hook-length control protein FliK [Desulfomonilia bacterium]
MSSPIVHLLGLASSALGILKKVVSPQTAQGSFDSHLETALSGGVKQKGARPSEMMSTQGVLGDDVLDRLMSCPSAAAVHQYIHTLMSLGISVRDIQAILSGRGDTMSDDALKKLLVASGLNEESIQQIMSSDTTVLAEFKGEIAAALKEHLHSHCSESPAEVQTLLMQSTVDEDTMMSFLTEFHTGQISCGAGEQLPPEIQTIPLSFRVSEEIMATVQAAVKAVNKSLGWSSPVAFMSAESPSPQPDMKMLGESIQMLEKDFTIPRETLKELFFSDDQNTRSHVVEDVSSKVRTYLKMQGQNPLVPQVGTAIGLLKSSMSDQEFSSIENAIRTWHPNLAVHESPGILSRGGFMALMKVLGENPGLAYDRQVKQVIDQLRRGLPAHLRNSEGSVTLKLHPPMLGRVDVMMKMDDGQLHATFRTDSPITRDMLQQNIVLLKEALAEQGIRSTQFTVTAGIESALSEHDHALHEHARQGNHLARQSRGSNSSDEPGTGQGDPQVIQNVFRRYPLSGTLDIFA